MSRLRVLFVDDEPAVLGGLADRLRRRRREWDMRFVAGGAAGLEALRSEPLDVLVTDVRMPDVDGVALLRAAWRERPEVVRLALSGQVDPDAVREVLSLAHDFLAKPCDADELAAAVQRCRAGPRVPAETARLLGGPGRLPSLPAVHAELQEALTRSTTTAELLEVTAILERDVGLARRVLEAVEPATVGGALRLADLGHAVRFLGCDRLSDVVLGAAAVQAFEGRIGSAVLDAVHAHSLRSARLASRVATDLGGDASLAFTAGLLHEVGHLALLAAGVDPGSWGDDGSRRAEAARADAGAYLLDLWGVPGPVLRAVRLHRAPPASEGAALAVHVAHALDAGAALDEAALDARGVRDRVTAWRALSAPAS